MMKVDRTTHLRTRKGGVVRKVRETYLRDDVEVGVLPGDLTHYIVPDVQATADYAELFEQSEFQGIIFLQTAYQELRDRGSRRTFHRVRDMVTDLRKGAVLFSNEHCRQTHRRLAVHRAATWIFRHMGEALPIVLLSDDAVLAGTYGSETVGVLVLSVADYLQQFLPDEPALWARYESLRDAAALVKAAASSTRVQSANEFGFTDYLASEVVTAGVKSGLYLQGVIHVDKHQPDTAVVRVRGAEAKDAAARKESTIVHIVGSGNRNRAVHGDIVAVELHDDNHDAPGQGDAAGKARDSGRAGYQTGRVIGVCQRKWRDYVVTLPSEEATGSGRGRVLGVPMDMRVPKIRFATQARSALQGRRLIVRIDTWPVSSCWPEGHFVEDLGPVGDLDTETRALLSENSIKAPPFGAALLAEMPVNTPEQPWKPSPEEVARRRDIRHSHLVFSIDPKGCEDVDDVLGARRLPNGNLELSVHIADVTHFLKPGMLADAEASSRATTVYLIDRRYDMLPGILSADLCSLLGDVDRYAMSVICELDGKTFDVVSRWFGRTIIRSSYQMYYELAQDLYNGAPASRAVREFPVLQQLPRKEAEKRVEDAREAIGLLTEIARAFKRKRTDTGGLDLGGAEIQVKLEDKSGSVERLLPKADLEMHNVVAECMIFANQAVAEKISAAFPSASLLRHHPLPKQEHFADLVLTAAAKGFHIDTSSNVALARSLDAARDPDDPDVHRVLKMLASEALEEAAYFCTGSVDAADWFHYGLGLQHYTHFTSPIRRYADVLVHRQLTAALEKEEEATRRELAAAGIDAEAENAATPVGLLAAQARAPTDLQELAEHINLRNRASKVVQRDSLRLFQSLYFSALHDGDSARNAEGIVVQIRDSGLLVHLPHYGFKGVVHLADLHGVAQVPACLLGGSGADLVCGGTVSRQDDDTITVTSASGSTVQFSLFDKVRVHVDVIASDYRTARLQLRLLDVTVRHDRHAAAAALSKVPPGSRASEDTSSMVRAVLAESAGAEDRVAVLPPEARPFRQSEQDQSLYNLLQSMEDLALTPDTDVDGC